MHVAPPPSLPAISYYYYYYYDDDDDDDSAFFFGQNLSSQNISTGYEPNPTNALFFVIDQSDHRIPQKREHLLGWVHNLYNFLTVEVWANQLQKRTVSNNREEVGPTGEIFAPVGSLDMVDGEAAFREQAEGLAAGGAASTTAGATSGATG